MNNVSKYCLFLAILLFSLPSLYASSGGVIITPASSSGGVTFLNNTYVVYNGSTFNYTNNITYNYSYNYTTVNNFTIENNYTIYNGTIVNISDNLTLNNVNITNLSSNNINADTANITNLYATNITADSGYFTGTSVYTDSYKSLGGDSLFKWMGTYWQMFNNWVSTDAYNITLGAGGWFFGQFGWTVDDNSKTYLDFNGTQLTFNETTLNATIVNLAGSTDLTDIQTNISNLKTAVEDNNATQIADNITVTAGYEARAYPGICPDGQFVNETNSTGVVCAAPPVAPGSDWSEIQTNLTYEMDARIGNDTRIRDDVTRINNTQLADNITVTALANTKAYPGICPNGQFVNETNSTGVVCAAPPGASDWSEIQTNLTYEINGRIGNDSALSVNDTSLGTWISNVVTNLSNEILGRIANITALSVNDTFLFNWINNVANNVTQEDAGLRANISSAAVSLAGNISSANATASARAYPGRCPNGQFVNETNSTGVVCAAPPGVSDWSEIQTNLTYEANARLSNDTLLNNTHLADNTSMTGWINAVVANLSNIPGWITAVASNLSQEVSGLRANATDTAVALAGNISSANATASARAYPGMCPTGQVVNGTNSTGVVCIAVSATGNPFNQILNTSSNVTFQDVNATGFIYAQPITGSIGSGIIWASEWDARASLNVTNSSGVTIKYPALLARLISTDGSRATYCNLTNGTYNVPDNQQSIVYLDTTCTVQAEDINTYVLKDISPGGRASIFYAMAHSGSIESLQGGTLLGKVELKERQLTIRTDQGRILSGFKMTMGAWPNYTVSAGEFQSIRDIVPTSIQNMSLGAKVEYVYHTGAATWGFSDGVGINNTICDTGTGTATCTGNNYRRHFIFNIGWNASTSIGEDKTELHQLLPLQSLSYSSLANCMDTITNPLTYTLPTEYKYSAVMLYAYCAKRTDTSWVTSGQLIDLRTARTDFASSSSSSSFPSIDSKYLYNNNSYLSINETRLNITINQTIYGEASKLNTNSSTWWSGLTGILSKYIFNNNQNLSINETALNATIVSTMTDTVIALSNNISSANATASARAYPGRCPNGQVVNETNTTGVVCVAMSGGDWSGIQTNVTNEELGRIGNDTLLSINDTSLGTWISNVASNLSLEIAGRIANITALSVNDTFLWTWINNVAGNLSTYGGLLATNISNSFTYTGLVATNLSTYGTALANNISSANSTATAAFAHSLLVAGNLSTYGTALANNITSANTTATNAFAHSLLVATNLSTYGGAIQTNVSTLTGWWKTTYNQTLNTSDKVLFTELNATNRIVIGGDTTAGNLTFLNATKKESGYIYWDNTNSRLVIQVT